MTIYRTDPWQPAMDKLMADLDCLIQFATVDGELLLEMRDACRIIELVEDGTIQAMIELREVVDQVRAKEEAKRN